MRYVSQLFQPVLTIPKNAKVKSTEITSKSQKLLLECGFVHPTSSGLFAMLPLGKRVLDKLEDLVSSVLESVGAQKISLPALTSSSLWESTGRLETCATELIAVTDRHEKDYVLSPTYEEAVADLLADVGPLSYKQLPLILYQMSNKYRDEFRPKHGLLRSREFLMMDAYSLHADNPCAEQTYCKISNAYQKLFDRLEMTVHRVLAPSGDMGGTISHEWHVAADAGEDRLAVCDACRSAARANADEAVCTLCGTKSAILNSIEVAHTFILGTRYSEALGANFTPQSGVPAPMLMSCYGVGLSRLAAACVEVKEARVLRWPTVVAPYVLCAIGPKEGSKEWSSGGAEVTEQICRRLVQEVPTLAQDVMIDDRHHMTIGKRMMHADRTGYPFIIVCGKSAIETPPRYELHVTNQEEMPPQLLTFDEMVDMIKKLMPSEKVSPIHEIPHERIAS